MTLPLFTPMKPRRDIAEEMIAEGRAALARERAGMTDEQIMQLEKRIETERVRSDRGELNGERLHQLERQHYRERG